MNSGRLIGIIAMVVGVVVAALGGLFLAQQMNAGDLQAGGAIVGAFFFFIPVALLVGFGIFMYVRGGQEASLQSEMEDQRKLLDIVKTRGQVDMHQLAIEMQSDVETVKSLLYQLVGLQVFSGYVNWDKGMLYSAEAANLRDLHECENCGAPIELAGKGVIACKFCGTEYFLS